MSRKEAFFVVLFLLALLVAPVHALVLQVLQLSGVQSNGTDIGYFHKQPLARSWNFKGGAAYNSSTKNLDISADWTGPSPTPSCTAATRGQHYTAYGPDGGADTTWFCCEQPNGSFSTILGYCH